MSSNLVPASIMGASALLSAGVSIFVAHKRLRAHGAPVFSLLMLAVAVWAAAAGLEAGLAQPAAKLLAAQFSYFGIVSVPVLWLIFAMRYARHDRWVTPLFLALIWLIPVVTLVLVFTGVYHGLIWSSTTYVESSGTMVYEHGWWLWVSSAYAYVVMIVGTALVLSAAVTGRAVYRRQAVAISVGAIVPWLANLVYLTGNSPWPGTDPAPVAFTLAGGIMAWALARYGLLDLVPIARDVLVESMADAVLVIDPGGRLVDVNPAAAALFGIRPADLGLQAAVVLRAWSAMVPLLQCQDRDKTEVWLHAARGGGDGAGEGGSPGVGGEDTGPAEGDRRMEVQTTVLRDARGRSDGCLLVLHDITARSLAEAELKESERALARDIAERVRLEEENARLLEAARRRAEEADTLRQAAAAVAASLRLDVAIDRVLEEVKRVVPYDAGAVWLATEGSLTAVGVRDHNSERMQSRGEDVSLHADGDDEEQGAITALLRDLDGPAREVVERLRPVVLGRRERSSVLIPGSPTAGLESWLAVPLLVHDRLIGVMELASAQRDRFGVDDARLVEAFADQVAVVLENAQLFEQTQRLAITDPLTGLYNRRYFFEQGEKELERARRYPPKNVCAIMLDIDHFKTVNDRFGHATGDLVLKEVARVCREGLRRMDLLARVGGEEFAILLPETALAGGRFTAERLRAGIENLAPSGLPHITVSMGVAEYTPECANLDMLLTWCDRALYAAKERGRNRVVTFVRRPDEESALV